MAGSVLVCATLLPPGTCAQTAGAMHAEQAPSTHTDSAVGHALQLPPEAVQVLNRIYDGDLDGAVPAAQQLQRSAPRNPLGYILEAEARWWKIYCTSSSVKWGMVSAWRRGKMPGDSEYLALLDRKIALANDALAANDSAVMHLYAGIGLAMKAQLYSLQGEYRATARTAVAARSQFLRTVE
jgi:hypothetical protein